MLETAGKTKDSKRTLSEMQEEIIAIQSKAIVALEDNVKLLREQIELRQRIFNLEMQVDDTIQVTPIHNGIIKIMEESRK
jgi:TRAP-type uncharacterized transport system substrate-binding protein